MHCHVDVVFIKSTSDTYTIELTAMAKNAKLAFVDATDTG